MMQQRSLIRQRHRGYAGLLLACLLLMGTLMLPRSLIQLVNVGYLILPFVLLISLGSPGEDGRFTRLKTSLYRLLSGLTLVGSVVWFFVPSLFQRGSGMAVIGLWILLVIWSCERLIRYLALERRVNRDVLMGALAGYLLLGLSVGLLFNILEIVVPGSFAADPDLKSALSHSVSSLAGQGAQQAIFVELNYFAFITLTTTGYGDIHPLTSQAQMICVFCSIAGTTYLALVMGLLISRYSAADVADELDHA